MEIKLDGVTGYSSVTFVDDDDLYISLGTAAQGPARGSAMASIRLKKYGFEVVGAESVFDYAKAVCDDKTKESVDKLTNVCMNEVLKLMFKDHSLLQDFTREIYIDAYREGYQDKTEEVRKKYSAFLESIEMNLY